MRSVDILSTFTVTTNFITSWLNLRKINKNGIWLQLLNINGFLMFNISYSKVQ